MRRACRITACLLPATAATPASADPWDLVDDRILGDPAFLPSAGEVEGSIARQLSRNVGFSAPIARWEN